MSLRTTPDPFARGPIIHHLNCAPLSFKGRTPLVGHCLLIEAGASLILVDTGIGTLDTAHPRRLDATYRRTMRPQLHPVHTAVHQIRALGYRPGDVTDIVLTQLGLDHAGGLPDFPQARVHVHADEYRAAMRRDHRADLHRYLPAHWAHGPRWAVHETTDHYWLDVLPASRILRVPPVLLIPLPGPTSGHCAVAVGDGDRWLLHAGDAYYFHGEIDPRHPRCPRALERHQRAVARDHRLRLDQLQALRDLRGAYPHLIDVFCAHDAYEYERLVLDSVPRW